MALAGEAVPTRDPGRLTVDILWAKPAVVPVASMNPDVGGRVELGILEMSPPTVGF